MLLCSERRKKGWGGGVREKEAERPQRCCFVRKERRSYYTKDGGRKEIKEGRMEGRVSMGGGEKATSGISWPAAPSGTRLLFSQEERVQRAMKKRQEE